RSARLSPPWWLRLLDQHQLPAAHWRFQQKRQGHMRSLHHARTTPRAYMFHHWRDAGRQRREYIPVADVAWVTAGIERWAIDHPDGRRRPGTSLISQRLATRWCNQLQRGTRRPSPAYPFGEVALRS